METASQQLIFILTITHHPRLGVIVLPSWAKQTSKPYLSISERLSSFNLSNYEEMLPDYAQEITHLADDYADANLLKRFTSKKFPAQNFFKNITPEYFNDLIRPFIERRMDQIFRLAVSHQIPVYLDEGSPNLYPEGRLQLNVKEAETTMNFTRTEEGTRYVLEVYQNDKHIKLTSKESKVICCQPCWLRNGRQLHYFSTEFDGKKLEPFIRKEFIAIPKSAEKKYFEAFILKNLKTSTINAEGFEILDLDPERKVNLALETDLNGRPVLAVYFVYSNKQVLAGKKQQVFVDLKIDEENYVFYRISRQPAWEKQVSKQLTGHGLVWINEHNHLTLKQESDNNTADLHALVEWINRNEALLQSIGASIIQHHNATKYFTGTIQTDFKVQDAMDWFDIYAIIHFGSHFQIPFIHLRKYILKGIREFVLPDGEVAILPAEWFVKYKEMMLFSTENEQSLRLQKHHFRILSENLFEQEKEIQAALQRLDFRQAPPVMIPTGLNATLRSYQQEGLQWMQFLHKQNFGGCLADDMGLGKTVQTLSLLLGIQQENEADSNATTAASPNDAASINVRSEGYANSSEVPDLFSAVEKQDHARKTSLIVMPASLIHNWKNEILRFAPSLKALIHTGNTRYQHSGVFKYWDLVLTTYGTLRNDLELLKDFHFHYVILDESQTIKNPESITSQAAIALSATHRLVLTGTPIENSLIDLWSQMNFLNKGLLGNLTMFKNEYLNPLEKEGDAEAQKKLQQLIQPFILRRRKEEVARDLPPLIEDIRYCEMTDDQQKIYEREKTRIRHIVLESLEKKGVESSAIEILKAMMHLRQLSNHPLMTDAAYSGDSGKFDEVMESIQNLVEENNKVLVFSSFVKHLRLFANRFETLGLPYALLTGATVNREKAVDEFKYQEDTRIFLISIKAGGTGLNLTEADYVFILDPWWNPAVEQQAISRAHRIGQNKNVIVYKFITKDTIEEKILKLQQHKLQLAESFVPSNNPLKDFNREDIVELFQ